MRLLRRLRDTSLLARFGAISLLLTIAVGVVLSSVLSTALEDRARQQSEDAALMAVRLGLQPQFTPADLAGGFDGARL
ncbi:MAG: Diguanylate cyclase protein, partial [Blastococcus sp.]|nr:Diguanylate cyclase protein [Blastococcus sp.]